MRIKPFILISTTLLVLGWSIDSLAHDPARPDRMPIVNGMSPSLERMHRERGVTPYGDFCPRCNLYGVSSKPVSHKTALDALTDYFRQKGLTVKNIRGMGRFLKADIFRDGRLVDRILFDRKTGRVRSIF